MKNYEKKIELEDKKLKIQEKIDRVVTKITKLELDKISLMMLYKETSFDLARESLELAFTPQLKKMLSDKVIKGEQISEKGL